MLSKRAQAYRPGRGVYRSAYKNAMRLARTEVNMAYLTADQTRWLGNPNIRGFRVQLSNNHTNNGKKFTDICDELQGDYPKTFTFKGWHPQCRCFATPIMLDPIEAMKQRRAAKEAGRAAPSQAPQITSPPAAFQDWVAKNAQRIAAARGRGTEPYWVKDNLGQDMAFTPRKLFSTEGLQPTATPQLTTLQQAAIRHQQRTQEQADAIQKRWDERNARQQQTAGEGRPHAAMKTDYPTAQDVDETMRQINSEFTQGKWFEHGDCVLTPTERRGVNGFTFMDGRISLRPTKLDGVRSAMAKIGKGRSADISFDEADAMATFWHEITHNRNRHGLMRKTRMQTDVMEMMNEFVARKTLPDFYARLGCPQTPQPQFINNRESTGYNVRVLGYDYVIQRLGLDPQKVLASAKENLFALEYTKQNTTAVQALLDGGLDTFKCVNGRKITRTQIRGLVSRCRDDYNEEALELYMRQEGIIL